MRVSDFVSSLKDAINYFFPDQMGEDVQVTEEKDTDKVAGRKTFVVTFEDGSSFDVKVYKKS